ncbi:glycosyltransferase family 4 protein [Oceaniserpentilla sp. 4NH20-0058]|uniref:glycosyltransferase family 4 protein n=1 Tax=Oceaniserpentilla sp. 4NH20-0058 TaxID=3127660 RepID=UPI0031036EEF
MSGLNQKILIISHGHPDHSKGGAEVAAYNLFKEYQAQGKDALFLARSGESSHGGSVFSSRNNETEVLFHTSIGDWFNLRCAESRHMAEHFSGLLTRFNPEVVHFHHYAHMGLEMIRIVKNTLPEAKIIFTLHEYMAICFNNGQMVKKDSTKLCYESNPVDCSQCFPEKSSADFFMRKQYIQSMFELVDHFISPSHFLIDRYKAWGIAEEKMTMIENGQPKAINSDPRPLASGEKRGRFAFFGQINPFKGIDVILEAFASLSEDLREQVHLDIHGANLHLQEESFQEKVNGLLEELSGVVTMHGSYEPHEMPRLLAECDWMIIPSIWWENSPMVIQEAYNHGRPVISADIGGMAEKIIDGKTGYHFRRGSHQSLASVIEKAVTTDQWSRIHNNIVKPINIEECAHEHFKVLENV